jgi:hypothetical protein
MVEMLFEMLGMLVADEPRQRRSDQAAGTAGNGCRRDRGMGLRPVNSGPEPARP